MTKLTREIKISWHYDDVKELDNSLTDLQVSNILESLYKNHDCNWGITWEHLGEAIQAEKQKAKK